MKARFLAKLIVILSFATCEAVSTRAVVVQFPEKNFSIDLPPESGWTRLKPISEIIVLSVRSSDQITSIQVLAVPLRNSTPEDFIQIVKQKLVEQGTRKITAEEQLTLNGYSARRLKIVSVLGGKKLQRTDTLVVHGGVVYQISALAFGSDPMSDPAVQKCVGSFHFLSESPITQFLSRRSVQKASDSSHLTSTDEKIIRTIANLTLLTLALVVLGYLVRRIVQDSRTKTNLPPRSLFPTLATTRTTPPPLPQSISNRSAGVSAPERLDAN